MSGKLGALDRLDPGAYTTCMNTNDPTLWEEVRRMTNHRLKSYRPALDYDDVHQNIACAVLEAVSAGRLDLNRTDWPAYVFQLINSQILRLMKVEAVQAQWKGAEDYTPPPVVSQRNRNRYMQMKTSELQEKKDPEEDVDTADYIDTWRMKLPSILDRLAPRQRQIVEMRFLQGLTLKQITDTLNLSGSTVRNTLKGALRRARKTAYYDENPEAVDTRDKLYRLPDQQAGSDNAGAKHSAAQSEG